MSNAIQNSPWIETGTYLGETTKYLAKHFPSVVTLEPSIAHFEYNLAKFRSNERVTILNAASEDAFFSVLEGFCDSVNIYLDGHYSGDGTFCGSNKTPIKEELAAIELALVRFRNIFVAIDDFRVFQSEDSVYPSNFTLVEFCKRNNLGWTVEHDMFLFFRRSSEKSYFVQGRH